MPEFSRKTEWIKRRSPGKKRTARGHTVYDPNRKIKVRRLTVTRLDTGKSLSRIVGSRMSAKAISMAVDEMQKELCRDG